MAFWSFVPLIAKGVSALVSKVKNKGSKVSDVGQVVSGAASGAAEGRQVGDVLASNMYRDQAAAELGKSDRQLQQASFLLQLLPEQYRQVLKGAIGKNAQDFKMAGPEGGFATSGGLRPSMLGPEAKQAADILMSRRLAEMLSGEKYGVTPVNLPQAPKMTKPGFMEKAAGAAGTGLSILGAILGKSPSILPSRDWSGMSSVLPDVKPKSSGALLE